MFTELEYQSSDFVAPGGWFPIILSTHPEVRPDRLAELATKFPSITIEEMIRKVDLGTRASSGAILILRPNADKPVPGSTEADESAQSMPDV